MNSLKISTVYATLFLTLSFFSLTSQGIKAQSGPNQEYVSITLINGRDNLVMPDIFMYDLDSISTNINSLNGIQLSDDAIQSVSVSDASISAMFHIKMADPSNPSITQVGHPINMYTIYTIQDLGNGLKKYTGSSSCCNEIIDGGTDLPRGELVQTGDTEAILTMYPK